jgi:hypothetical protein
MYLGMVVKSDLNPAIVTKLQVIGYSAVRHHEFVHVLDPDHCNENNAENQFGDRGEISM